MLGVVGLQKEEYSCHVLLISHASLFGLRARLTRQFC